MNNNIKSSENNPPNELSLQLIVHDNDVIKYLTKYESPEREEKALDALKVGVVAILSASPFLDTKVVEEKFSEIEGALKTYADAFKNDLGTDLKKYFEKEKGDVPLALSVFFGDQGKLSEYLKRYFDPESGKISSLLKNELGPSSAFAKSLDPANKGSVVSRIEEIVKNKLDETVKNVTEQFSLDKEDSSMSRVKKLFDDKVVEIKNGNEKFFSDLKTHLGMKEIQAEEAKKGTQKGRDFESELYPKVVILGQQLQDSTENVTGSPGKIPKSKKGDYVITLGETSGAPGSRLVIEAKKEQKYRLIDAIEEMKEAKENREAASGIFVFAKGYEPIEIGDFRIDGNDFYCTIDESQNEQNKSLIFLEAAYKIARVNIISQIRKEKIGKVDLNAVKENIKQMLEQAKVLSEIITKARTVKSHGEAIENVSSKLKEELEKTIQATLELLKSK